MAFRKMAFRSLIFYTVIQLIDGQHLPNSLLLREQTKSPVAFSAVRTANVDRETFLTQTPSQFPKPTLDGKVNAAEFLAASDHLAKFFGFWKKKFSKKICINNILSQQQAFLEVSLLLFNQI